MRTGGKILIDQLVIQGCRTLFTVPGESFLAALDALFDEGPIRTIVCRHEGGAAMMAEACGKLTGEPGVAFVTRAAGAANAVSGVYVAQHDSTPMVLLVGVTSRTVEDRDAFQEFDIKALFAPITKWAGVVRSPERIPEYVRRAFHTALAGRPGPVVLGVPENVLNAHTETADAARAHLPAPAPTPAEMTRLKNRLMTANRPLVIAGGPGWSRTAAQNLASFTETFNVPVATAFRRQDHIDNRLKTYVGHAGINCEARLAEGIRSADLVLIIGEQPAEITTGSYSILSVPNPTQSLVHVHPSPDEIGRLFHTDWPIVAAPEPFARALGRLKPPPNRRWERRRRDLRAAYQKSLKPAPTPGDVKLEDVITTLSAELPDDAIVTNGAGNYAAFLHRYFQYKSYPTQLAPTSGSMGYGLPAAIAAKITFPERPVVALAGDGCMLMTGQELATAVQYGLPIVLIVANNGMYGTIRMQQERHYPGRVLGTSLVNPDFAVLARAFGAKGETVCETAAFLPALKRALAARGPTVIELKLDPEAITPSKTLSEIRNDQEPQTNGCSDRDRRKK
jgi:acetolactate synthase-1/2/3 large subunit